MKHFLWGAAACLALISACAPTQSNTYTITAELPNSTFDGMKAVIYCNRPGNAITADTALVQDGKVVFTGVVDTTDFCQLGILDTADVFSFFILEPGDITVDLLSHNTPSGTPLNEIYTQNNSTQDSLFQVFREMSEACLAQYGEADAAMRDSAVNALDKETDSLIVEAANAMIAGHNDDAIAISLLHSLFFRYVPIEGQEEIIDSLAPWIQQLPIAQNFLQKIEGIKKTVEGMPYVNIEGEDPEGNPVALADFFGKGNYVLIDFWASWCGPCRGEIPNLAEVNKLYGKKGLTVVGCFVWDKKENLAPAMESEGITWPQIVTEERTATNLYGVSGIPQIILFSPEGTILRRDLRGEGIKQAVAEALKNGK